MIHNFAHGIMFHHFHSEVHLRTQGSFDKKEFRDILEWLNSNYNINNASDFLRKKLNNSLNDSDITITFDDGLKSQFDIALPVLNEMGIEAFFFVYSDALEKVGDMEIFRLFRTSEFKNIDDFYNIFFEKLRLKDIESFNKNLEIFESSSYLDNGFYSVNDRFYRYLRDVVLSHEQFTKTHYSLMKGFNFDIESAKNQLWITEEMLKEIYNMGHVIGLHSRSHPTDITKLSKSQQYKEYSMNLQYLEKLIGSKVVSMSHPCGRYNEDTLEVLTDIGIKIGFLHNISEKNNHSALKIPREDSANVYRIMRNSI